MCVQEKNCPHQQLVQLLWFVEAEQIDLLKLHIVDHPVSGLPLTLLLMTSLESINRPLKRTKKKASKLNLKRTCRVNVPHGESHSILTGTNYGPQSAQAYFSQFSCRSMQYGMQIQAPYFI
jgi:hypothetical protein